MGWLWKNNQQRPGRRRSASLDVSTHKSPTISLFLQSQQSQEENPANNGGLEKSSAIATSTSCLDVSDRTSSSSTSTLTLQTFAVPLELQEENEERDDPKQEEEEEVSSSATVMMIRGENIETTNEGTASTATTVVVPRHHKVRFDKVQTRYYAPCPTDNPSVLCGVPIGLDWTILHQHEDALSDDTDDSTSTTGGSSYHRRSYSELRLTSMERMERLRSFGYARSHLATVEWRVHRARQQRERTVQQVLRRANWKRRCSSLFSSFSFGSSSTSSASSSSSSAPRGRTKHKPIEWMF